MCFENKTAEMTKFALEVGKLPGLKGEPTPAQAKRTAIGWRAWKIKAGTEKNPVLVSMNNKAEWEPGKPMETHAVIDECNIGVGVHAFADPDAWVEGVREQVRTAQQTNGVFQPRLEGGARSVAAEAIWEEEIFRQDQAAETIGRMLEDLEALPVPGIAA